MPIPIQLAPVGLENFQKARSHQSIKIKNLEDGLSKLTSLVKRGYHDETLRSLGVDNKVQLAPESKVMTGVDQLYQSLFPTEGSHYYGFFEKKNVASLVTSPAVDTSEMNRIYLYNDCLLWCYYPDGHPAWQDWIRQQGLDFPAAFFPSRDKTHITRLLGWSALEASRRFFWQFVGPKTVNQKTKPLDGRRIELAL